MALPARREIFSKLALLGGLAAIGTAAPAAAQAPSKRFIKREASDSVSRFEYRLTEAGREQMKKILAQIAAADGLFHHSRVKTWLRSIRMHLYDCGERNSGNGGSLSPKLLS